MTRASFQNPASSIQRVVGARSTWSRCRQVLLLVGLGNLAVGKQPCFVRDRDSEECLARFGASQDHPHRGSDPEPDDAKLCIEGQRTG